MLTLTISLRSLKAKVIGQMPGKTSNMILEVLGGVNVESRHDCSGRKRMSLGQRGHKAGGQGPGVSLQMEKPDLIVMMETHQI